MKRGLLAVSAVLLSCTERATVTERPSDMQAALGGEVAARVDGEAIPLSLVRSVSEAQHVPAKEALRKLIDDEIAANAAKKRGFAEKNPTSWNLTATRARIIADRLHDRAREAGPPTNEEIERLSERHWAEVDRPPTVVVMHTLAIRPKDAQRTAEARSVAEALLIATKDATTDAQFEAKAKAVPHPKEIETRVEKLPPFTNDGWVPGGGNMDATFAAAAYALPRPGAMTGVVETTFGWHVIRLISRLPEQRMALEDRRKAFAEEVVAMRGHDTVTALVKELTAKTRIEVAPTAASLMQSVPIASEQAANP